MSNEKIGERGGRALVKENAHYGATAGASKLRAAKSRTAMTWSRVRPSYSLTSSSMVTPSSRFSNTMETGIRVPRNTHAPLTFPGTLSTAGHWDQSSAAIFVLLFRVKGNRRLVTTLQSGAARLRRRQKYR